MRFLGVLIILVGHLLIAEVYAADDSGVVQAITGDVAFVSGLNGSAPFGSQLEVDNGTGTEGTRLQVIKHRDDDVLVARVVKENGSPLKVSDRIRVVTTTPSGEAERTVHTVRVDDGPKIDGRLDDVVWQEAKTVEGFLQREPEYWAPSTERTVARVIYDNSKIYFGFECYDSEPSRIVANNMRRDSDVFADDNVQILLDPYNDRQTGVFFFVNPLGAKRDVLLSREGRTFNDAWDCIWEAKTYRHDRGWSAEIAIPFDQLRFKEEDASVWGINLGRHVARKTEETVLMMGERAATSAARYRTSNIAELHGLKSLKTKKVFQIKPYVLPGAVKDLRATDPSAKTSFESGVDVRYGVTPNMTLDVSYNTDFAQVEGDQEQVNLTQFSQFFPEKREFFLEGSSVFEFGESASRRGGDARPPTILFYSRRIGLESGQPVPIIVGSKLAGKAGNTRIGVLNALTDAKTFQNGKTVQRSNFSVVRVKQDVMGSSNVGAILVNKQTSVPGSGWDAYNRAAGVDFSYSPTSILNFQGFYARTWDPSIGDADDARFLQMTYSGSVYSGTLKFMDVEENFEPRAGFVNRRGGLRGLRRYNIEGRARVNLKNKPVRYFLISPRARVITDRDDNAKFWDARMAIYPRFRTGDWFRFILTRTHDVVERRFRPSKKRPHIVIPHGTYKFTTFSTGPFPSRTRKLRPEFDFEFGTYYTGKRYTFSTESVYKPSGQLSIETDYEVNFLRLPQENFNIQALSTRVIYSFSTDLYVKLFAQWNNDTESVGMNFLMNYRFKPGSDIYLVYDQGFDTLGGLAERNRALLVKVSYMLGM